MLANKSGTVLSRSWPEASRNCRDQINVEKLYIMFGQLPPLRRPTQWAVTIIGVWENAPVRMEICNSTSDRGQLDDLRNYLLYEKTDAII